MIPSPLRSWLTAALALLLGTGPAFADGKMVSERVPTTIPYQKAPSAPLPVA